jgi:hypothetical protein
MATTFSLVFTDDVNPADIHDIVFDTLDIIGKHRQVQITGMERPTHIPASVTIDQRR